MKFIFPQNYDFSTKLFGLIDYSTAILNIIWSGFILIVINIIFESLNIKIFLFIIFTFPVLLFSVIGINRREYYICNDLSNKIFSKTKIIFL